MSKPNNRKKQALHNRTELQANKVINKQNMNTFKIDLINVKTNSVQSQRKPLSQIESQIYNRFKDSLLQQKLKDNKSIHLKIKEQNQMIENIKNQILDHKATELSSFISETLEEGSIANISKKLGVLQKSYLQKDKLSRIQPRTRMNRNIKKQQTFQLLDQQIKEINRLPAQCISKIFNIYRSYKRNLQKCAQLEKMQDKFVLKQKEYIQKMQDLKVKLLESQIQKQQATQQKNIKDSEYKNLQQKIEQMLAEQRLKCLFEFKQGQRNHERDLQRLNC